MYDIEIYNEKDFISKYSSVYKYFVNKVNSISNISLFEFCQFLMLDGMVEISYMNYSTEESAMMECNIDKEGNITKEYNFSIEAD